MCIGACQKRVSCAAFRRRVRTAAAQAGHILDLSRLEPAPWIEASKVSFQGSYKPMARCIARAIEG